MRPRKQTQPCAGAEGEKVLSYGRRYYLANRDRILAQCKEYRERNKEAKKASDKAYYEANKEKIKGRSKSPQGRATQKKYAAKVASDPKKLKKKREMDRLYSRRYRERHPEKRKESSKRYRDKNKQAAKEYFRKRVSKDPEKYRESAASRSRKHRAAFVQKHGACYSTLRRKRDAHFATAVTIRSRVGVALSRQNARKSNRTLKLVGCTTSELMAHLESKFAPGMSWENRGEWHIDHIVPLAAFDLSDKDQQAAAFHYTNLQPLWKKDNLAKGSKVPGQVLFGFAYAAKIADGMISMRQVGRRKDGTRQHGHD
jgi:hypothetical protein